MAFVAALTALRLAACFGLGDASVPAHWIPPRAEASNDASANEEVVLTSSGTMHRPSKLLRSHADHEEAVFQAFDQNGDGLASPAEVKIAFKQGNRPVPKDLAAILNKMDGNHDSGISLAEFTVASKKHADYAEGHKRHHGHRHRSLQPVSLEQDRDVTSMAKAKEGPCCIGEPEQNDQVCMTCLAGKMCKDSLDPPGFATCEAESKAEDPDADAWVTCGGHKAPTCEECTTTNSVGQTVIDHGEGWCHADCVYYGGKCHKQDIVTVDSASKGNSSKPVPDILNPKITEHDQRTIDNSAEAAIREENAEASEKLKEQEEAIRAQQFTWSKFWLITIITLSVILGICACVSVCGLVVYFYMPTRGKKADDDEYTAMNDEYNSDEATGESTYEQPADSGYEQQADSTYEPTNDDIAADQAPAPDF